MTAMANGLFESGTFVVCATALGLAIVYRHSAVINAHASIMLANWLAAWAFLLWYPADVFLICATSLVLVLDASLQGVLYTQSTDPVAFYGPLAQLLAWLALCVVQLTRMDINDSDPASIGAGLVLTLVLRTAITLSLLKPKLGSST